MRTPHRFVLCGAALTAVVLTACGGSTAPAAGAAGTYQLVAIGGAALPFTGPPAYDPAGDSARALSGALTLAAAGAGLSYTATEVVETWYSGVYAPPAFRIDTIRGQGTFARDGDSLRVLTGDGFVGDGRISGSTVVMDWDTPADLYTYRRP